MIDELCAMHPEEVSKPRTYRQRARKDFLALCMKKKLSKKALRKGLGKQLRYLRRNLEHIARLSGSVLLTVLSARWHRDLLVIGELCRQQLEMWQSGKKSISDRIVSISQPHVRPIVRGKAAAKTEFGMKLSISVVDGISMPERMSWNAYNEGCDLWYGISSGTVSDTATILNRSMPIKSTGRWPTGCGARLEGSG